MLENPAFPRVCVAKWSEIWVGIWVGNPKREPDMGRRTNSNYIKWRQDADGSKYPVYDRDVPEASAI